MEHTQQPETPGDMLWQQQVTTERECQNTSNIAPPLLGKRRRSSLSNDGDNGNDEEASSNPNLTTDSTGPFFPQTARPVLHVSVPGSPGTSDKQCFEPLHQEEQTAQPPAKKVRTENRIEITYDCTGTPLLSSFRSSFPRDTFDAVSPTQQDLLTPDLINSARLSPKKQPFSLIHAICRDNDLLLHFVSFLSIPSLISLYAISKPFHYLFNRHHTAFTLSIMRTWAPEADKIFPWHCYKSLCVKDPSKLQKARLEGKEDDVRRKWDDVRDVPSLRWLQMVVWRQGVCKDMCIQLAVNGLRSPPGTLDALRRMWFLMDLPLNSQRLALIRTPSYISTKTLEMMTYFLLKVDMLFTDPVHPPFPVNHPDQLSFPNHLAGGSPSGVPLRKMLLAERHLTSLWRVMRGWTWDPREPQVRMTRMDVLRLWVRHRYSHPPDTPEHVKKQSIMSMPWWEVGASGYERTGVSFFNLADDKKVVLSHPSIAGSGMAEDDQQKLLYPHRRRLIFANEKPREKLLRPDELLIRECIRRGMAMHTRWARMMLYGFSDDAGHPFPVLTEEQYLAIGRKENPFSEKMKANEGEGEESKDEATALPGMEELALA